MTNETASSLSFGDLLTDGRCVNEIEVLGDLVRIVWAVPTDGDFRRVEEFVLATKPYTTITRY